MCQLISMTVLLIRNEEVLQIWLNNLLTLPYYMMQRPVSGSINILEQIIRNIYPNIYASFNLVINVQMMACRLFGAKAMFKLILAFV